ncbi:MAG: diaminopimelate epimerase [Gemmatimonadaceae bacterium]
MTTGATGSILSVEGIAFTKMTGSGNDFVFFDGRSVDLSDVTSPEIIRAICSRHNGIGADGVVVLQPGSLSASDGDSPPVDARIHYFNSDGTPADLCGNATLCSTAMAAVLGLGEAEGMALGTPAGRISSRLSDGLPEIDLPPVTRIDSAMALPLVPGERRMGYLLVGIPHLVIVCEDVEQVDVAGRGPGLRYHPALGAAGANVNWVSAQPDGSWRYRTYERGVEGETQACGTGAVGTAILLCEWGLTAPPVRLITTSGRPVTVTLTRSVDGGLSQWQPSLRGEGRIVFRGQIGDLGLDRQRSSEPSIAGALKGLCRGPEAIP